MSQKLWFPQGWAQLFPRTARVVSLCYGTEHRHCVMKTEGTGPFPEFSSELSCITQWQEHIHTLREGRRLLSTSWSCDRQGLLESWCLIIFYINRMNPSLPWGRSCCFTHVAKRTKSQITSLSLNKPPHLAGQPQTCIHKEFGTELGTRAADTYLKP